MAIIYQLKLLNKSYYLSYIFSYLDVKDIKSPIDIAGEMFFPNKVRRRHLNDLEYPRAISP